MQRVILTTGSDRNLILSDDGTRYIFASSEWRSNVEEPEVGMRVDFEDQGSAAVDIFPIPVPQNVPTSQLSTAAPVLGTGTQTQPTGPTVAERIAETFRRMNDALNARYSPMREAIGDYGVIGVGIALLVIGCLFFFDIFEDLLDVVGSIGIVAGAAIVVLGFVMLGKEEGWWGGRAAATQSGTPSGSPIERSNASTQHGQTPQQSASATIPSTAGQEVASNAASATKTCPHCDQEILSAAIICRHCRSDVSSQTQPTG